MPFAFPILKNHADFFAFRTSMDKTLAEFKRCRDPKRMKTLRSAYWRMRGHLDACKGVYTLPPLPAMPKNPESR